MESGGRSIRKLVGALDQGTSSSRFAVLEGGVMVACAQKEHTQYHPEIGWVEHDLEEVWAACMWCIEEAMGSIPGSDWEMAAVGVTNQRETACAWDASGTPVVRAVSWNCTRTEGIAREAKSFEAASRLKTGLPMASYFTATKLKWLFREYPWLADREDVMLGTVDSYLVYRLTGAFKTDVTNASRTLLFNLKTLDWDDELLRYWGVPKKRLPEIEPSIGGDFGLIHIDGPLRGVKIAAVLGDQQAATFGQCCFERGDVKATFGTGAFVLMNAGLDVPETGRSGLLATVLFQIKNKPPIYALEGAIAVAGTAVQWLRDNLELAPSATEVAQLAASVAGDNGGVYFVPALNGLFAPHWDDTARGALLGLTSYATKAHVCRAALEAVAFQLDDLLSAFRFRPKILKVDGGMTVNQELLQFCADILDVTVTKPQNLETTAAGAALGAGFAVGLYRDLDHLRAHAWRLDMNYLPALDLHHRAKLRRKWHQAVARARGWETRHPTTRRRSNSFSDFLPEKNKNASPSNFYHRPHSSHQGAPSRDLLLAAALGFMTAVSATALFVAARALRHASSS